MDEEIYDWLKIAKSNLTLGKAHNKLQDENIRLEEFCFDLQQSIEKGLKALLLHNNIKFPKTHNITELIDLLEHNNISVPENIN